MSLQGLDRKAMEGERLARQKKRTALDAPSEITAVKRAKIIDLTVDSPEPILASETKVEPKNKTVTPSGSLQFPSGTIKKTWVFCQPRHNDIKIEEVLQNSTLTTAVLSSFQWDMEWLFSKLGSKTKTILVMGEKDIAAVCLPLPSLLDGYTDLDSKPNFDKRQLRGSTRYESAFHPCPAKYLVCTRN